MNSEEALRALLVTYVFPPTGGAGVGRVLKLSKYLPDHDVVPAVLTVSNPSVPLRDESQLRDVRPEMEILRARTFEPGYQAKQAAWSASTEGAGSPARRVKRFAASMVKQALIPDANVLWQPAAQVALARRLAARPDDVVFISAPPFSQFLLGPLTHLRRGTAVVLDYRDEWVTLRNVYEMFGRVHRLVGEGLEHALLRCAHAVTTATEAFRQNLLDRFRFLSPEQVVTIPNGYDPDDFPPALPEPGADEFVITYAGTIFTLTSPRGLLGAIRRLHRDEPELARLLRVRFLGRIVDTELPHFEGMEALGVERAGYVDKAEVTPALARSHMVLCLLDDVPGVERVYPAKVFELMYLGRPCLTISPPGALADLVRRHRLGPVAPPRDEAAIAAILERALRAFRDGEYQTSAKSVDIERYHRRAQAGEFAEVFRAAVRRAGGRR